MSNYSSPANEAFRWEMNWKICVASVLMLPILVGFGFWQLERAAQKTTIQQSITAQQAEPALLWHEYVSQKRAGEPEPFFRRVQLSGQFLPERYWLLENQIVDGRVGYDVIVPFQPDQPADSPAVLINRGWVSGSGNRRELPDISIPETSLEVSGRLMPVNVNRLLRSATLDPVSEWPKLILAVVPEKLESDLGQPVWPIPVQLTSESKAALTVRGYPLNMSASRHVGYAVQWFSMAIALLILTLIANSNLARVVKTRFSKKS